MDSPRTAMSRRPRMGSADRGRSDAVTRLKNTGLTSAARTAEAARAGLTSGLDNALDPRKDNAVYFMLSRRVNKKSSISTIFLLGIPSVRIPIFADASLSRQIITIEPRDNT